MEIKYSELTERQLAIIEDYCKDNMKKLKRVCYPIWGNKGLPSCYHDDLYDDAMNVLVESVVSYRTDNKTSFKTFLSNNIKLSQREWYRNTHLRTKRNNLELDENGKIKKDEDGRPIIIKNISFDIPIGENDDSLSLGEIIAHKTTVEKEIFEENEEIYSEEMCKYLERLSELQRAVLKLISIGFKPSEILEELDINQKMYEDCYNAIHSYRNTKVLM